MAAAKYPTEFKRQVDALCGRYAPGQAIAFDSKASQVARSFGLSFPNEAVREYVLKRFQRINAAGLADYRGDTDHRSSFRRKMSVAMKAHWERRKTGQTPTIDDFADSEQGNPDEDPSETENPDVRGIVGRMDESD